MTPRPTAPRDRRGLVAGAAVLAVMLATMGGLLAMAAAGPGPTRVPTSLAPSAVASPGTFIYPGAPAAPPIQLTDQDGAPFSLASLRGSDVLVFFGYTHCPDVCPATMGIVADVLGTVGPSTRAVFVTVDPERDTTVWLKEYIGYLRAGFTGLTGTDAEISATAEAWGVRYARVETGTPGAYSMSHTADVYLVDGDGHLRARFPFGTQAATMVQVVRSVVPPPPVPAAPSPLPSVPSRSPLPSTSDDLGVHVVSSSMWSGGSSPAILSLTTAAGPVADPAARPVVQLISADGSQTGAPVTATPVKPPGVDAVSYVASLDIPSPGTWSASVTIASGGRTLRGATSFTALDPGTSAVLGAPAPAVHTPTLSDAGGVMRAISTDPDAAASMYQRSTTDLLASHMPFVLVLDSTLFRVSPVCGKAVIMARYLTQRWADAGFVHAEPFVYTLVSDWPVLSGDIADPPLDAVSTGWGIGGAPWGSRSVPWVFVVDGDGVVRAKYEGLIGTADVDVMLALITGDR